MTLEYRNGRPVYYRNKRHNGKVIRHYVASGSMALLAAEQDAHRRAQQLARRLAEEELQMAYVEAREKLHNIAGQVETLTRAMLIDAGYHQRNRGPWRRRMK